MRASAGLQAAGAHPAAQSSSAGSDIHRLAHCCVGAARTTHGSMHAGTLCMHCDRVRLLQLDQHNFFMTGCWLCRPRIAHAYETRLSTVALCATASQWHQQAARHPWPNLQRFGSLAGLDARRGGYVLRCRR
jgi:hypothetical protein